MNYAIFENGKELIWTNDEPTFKMWHKRFIKMGKQVKVKRC